MVIIEIMKNTAPTRILLLAAVLIGSQLSSFARNNLDLGLPASGTPYDPYMAPVKQVLTHLTSQEDSMDRVRYLMEEGRDFRYDFNTPYVAATPAETAMTRSGDCKAKALWLADQLNDTSVRFVIGKARSTSQMSHAWLLWQHENRWYILDCTNNSYPIPADHVSSNEYIPLYSFSKDGEFRHHATETPEQQMAYVASSKGLIAQR
jgi:hypothetical protein